MHRLARTTRPAAPPQRRDGLRHVCVEGGVASLAVRPAFGGRRALLIDLSAGGAGLVIGGAPLEPGAALAVQLSAPGVEARPARVAHCRPCPTPAAAPWLSWRERLAAAACRLLGLPEPRAARAWIVGCEFTRPLTEGELREVLGPAAGPPP